MAAGIVSWGVYLPYWRLDRAAIGAAFGTASGRGTPGGRLLRRGHHHPRGGGGPPGAATSPGVPGPGRPLLLHPGAGLPGQDQRHHHPRRPGPAGRRAAPTTSAVRCARGGPPCDLAALAGEQRPADGGRLRPAHRPGRRSGGEPGRGRGRGLRLRPRGRGGRGARARRRPPTSSSTAGGCPARPPPASGRTASARRRYVPLARPAFAEALDRGRTDGRRRRPPGGGRAARPGGRLAAEGTLGVPADRVAPDYGGPDREPRRRPGRRWAWPTCWSGPRRAR